MNFCFSGVMMQNLNSLVSSAQQLNCCYLLIRMDVTFMRWFKACSFLLCVFFSSRSSKPLFLVCLVSVPCCGCCCYGVVWSFVGLWSLPFREDFTFLLTFLSARELSLTKSWAVDDAFPVPLGDLCHTVLPIILPSFIFIVFTPWVDYTISSTTDIIFPAIFFSAAGIHAFYSVSFPTIVPWFIKKIFLFGCTMWHVES